MHLELFVATIAFLCCHALADLFAEQAVELTICDAGILASGMLSLRGGGHSSSVSSSLMTAVGTLCDATHPSDVRAFVFPFNEPRVASHHASSVPVVLAATELVAQPALPLDHDAWSRISS